MRKASDTDLTRFVLPGSSDGRANSPPRKEKRPADSAYLDSEEEAQALGFKKRLEPMTKEQKEKAESVLKQLQNSGDIRKIKIDIKGKIQVQQPFAGTIYLRFEWRKKYAYAHTLHHCVIWGLPESPIEVDGILSGIQSNKDFVAIKLEFVSENTWKVQKIIGVGQKKAKVDLVEDEWDDDLEQSAPETRVVVHPRGVKKPPKKKDSETVQQADHIFDRIVSLHQDQVIQQLREYWEPIIVEQLREKHEKIFLERLEQRVSAFQPQLPPIANVNERIHQSILKGAEEYQFTPFSFDSLPK